MTVLAQESTGRTGHTDVERLSLDAAVEAALQNNPTIKAARAKWESARQRVPQAAAWEDPKLHFNSLLGRFVSIPANGFTDQALSVEQMIPLDKTGRWFKRIQTTARLFDSKAKSCPAKLLNAKFNPVAFSSDS